MYDKWGLSAIRVVVGGMTNDFLKVHLVRRHVDGKSNGAAKSKRHDTHFMGWEQYTM